MREIKFSHLYQKLLDEHNDMIDTATLLDVIPVELSECSRAFLDYDTDGGKFILPPKGKYLMLVFKKPKEGTGISADNLFTTLRRYTPEKMDYYRGLVGSDLQVVYAHENPSLLKEGV